MERAEITDVRAWLSPHNKRFWALIIIACYTLAGFFLVPWLIKTNCNELSRRFLMRDAEVKDVFFNPWTLRLQINGFVLHDTDQAELASFEELVINFQTRSILQLAFVFHEVSLTGPHVNLIRYKFADTNFGRMLGELEGDAPASTEAASQDSGIPRLVIDNLRIAKGAVNLRDELPATPFDTRLGPVDISIQNLSTLPDKSGQQSITIATENGSTLQWTGNLQITPLQSAGKIQLSGSPLPLVYRYLKDQLSFRIRDCCLDLNFDYTIQSLPDGQIAARVDNMSISSRDIEVLEPENDERILRVPEIRVSGGKLEWPERKISIAELLVDSPKLAIWIRDDGVVNLNTLLPTKDHNSPDSSGTTSPQAPVAVEPSATNTAVVSTDAAAREIPVNAAAAEPATAKITGTTANGETDWDLSVATLRIADMQVEFSDRSLARPGILTIPKLDVTVNAISNQPGSLLPFTVAAQTGAGGSLALQGDVVVLPEIKLDTQLEITNIAIRELQPWVEPVAQILISDGLFNFSGSLASSANELLAVKGDISLLNLAVSDTRENVPLLGWQRLALQKAHLQLSRGRLDIAQITFDKPFARLIIAADGTTNFQALGTGETAKAAATTAEQSAGNTERADTPATGPESADAKQPATASAAGNQATAPLAIHAGKTLLRNGTMEFGDFSLPLPFQVSIREFGGSISALATDSLASSDLVLEGKVGEYGYVKVDGALRAMAPADQADVSVIFRNISMPEVSPYTAKFAGRKIAAGKLDLDLNYNFDQHIVKGENKIVLEKFRLGEKIANPGALDLPLDLAVSLLTDSNGIIDLQLEVGGDLNDPTFSMGSIILKVFVNLITKAVTAPFKLLAGLLPGSPDIDLDTLDFPPGRADLLPPEQEKLDQLAVALAQRPQLVLTIPGAYNSGLDTTALQARALDTQLTEILGDTAETEEQELLTERTRNALEKLARKQLAELSLDDLQQQFQRPQPESQRTTLDEVAYMQELRRQLEAIQQIDASLLLALASDRQSVIIAQLTRVSDLPAGQLIPGTIGATADAEDGAVRLRLDVEAGESNPATTVQPVENH